MLDGVMKKTILLLLLVSVSAFATPVKYECNFMSTTPDDRYIQGRSKTGAIEENSFTAMAFSPFSKPNDNSAYLIRIESKNCEVTTDPACSEVTLQMHPSKMFRVVEQTTRIYPQRAGFKTFASGFAKFDVYDAEFHPMKAAVATFESKIELPGTDLKPILVKLVCIFRK